MNNNYIYLKCVIHIFVAHVVYRADGFCYNTYSKIVFSPETKLSNQSYFGYTTLLRDGDKPTIIVGAPRDNSNFITHKSIQNPGAYYTCVINFNKNNNVCAQKILDKSGNTRHDGSNGRRYEHRKDNMWLGMSLTGTTNNNGSVVMCAPRWINQFHRDHYLANGLCYTLSNTMTNTAQMSILIPLLEQQSQGFTPANPRAISTYGTYAYYYALGQAGISTVLSEDNTELLIGAPGVYVWTGTIIRYKITKPQNDVDKITKSAIPNPYYTTDLTDASYLGYSVGFGKFISNRDEVYVAGAPRGSDNKGEVYVFSFPKRDNNRLDIKAKLEGKKIGEYFGSTIATIDINQDGLTDLIIGAPMYAETSGWDIGRVYVYINQDKGVFNEQETAIYGSYRDGARFGTSISDIGDINGDGFIDVAIGAPYENHNSGAVYIYLGSANGLNPVYVQRITIDKMMGFGISISKGVDIDKNGCKDIAIGAYESENVVLLRCHPSVDIKPRIETIPRELSLNDTELTAQVCIVFQGYSRYKTELEVKMDVDQDYKRVKFANKNDAIFSITGSGDEETCKDIPIIIQPKAIDYSRPIEIKISYKLKKDPMRDYTFCPNCTVLRPATSYEFSIHVPIAAGCGDDLICRPDLKLKVEPITTSPFVIGSSPSIQLNITLENIGEPAFLTQIQIMPLINAPLLRVPTRCFLQESILFCDFDNPFLGNTQKSIIIEFSTSLLLNTDDMLTFNVSATSGGVEITPDDNNFVLNMTLASIANLVIDSNTAPTQFNYINNSDTERIRNITITHSFEILNTGPSPLNAVMLRFFLPISYLDKATDTVYNIAKVYEPRAFIDNQLMICNTISGSYFDNKNEFHSVDIFNDENSTDVEYTTTDKSPQYDNYTYQLDQKIIDEYISYLPASNDMDVPFTSLHINCTDRERVTCLVVECSGALHAIGSNGAQIHFKMDVNSTNLKRLLKDTHLITLSSYAMADSIYNPSGHTFNWAKSYIIGNDPPTKIPIWLLVLSIVLGLLSLATLIYALYKFGFFKRKTKDHLELLKNEEVKDESHEL